MWNVTLILCNSIPEIFQLVSVGIDVSSVYVHCQLECGVVDVSSVYVHSVICVTYLV